MVIKNKRGSHRDHFSIKINNRKGQFFILAAIIIVSIVVGLTVVKNYVTVGESSNQISQYSEEFGTEGGAVTDYTLFNGKSGEDLVSFFNESIANVITKYPNMEVYACYGNKTVLNCENWGKEDINITANNSVYYLEGGRKMVKGPISSDGIGTNTLVELRTTNYAYLAKKSFSSAGVENITIKTTDQTYILDLTKAVQSNQFYLVFKQNSTGGDITSGVA